MISKSKQNSGAEEILLVFKKKKVHVHLHCHAIKEVIELLH